MELNLGKELITWFYNQDRIDLGSCQDQVDSLMFEKGAERVEVSVETYQDYDDEIEVKVFATYYREETSVEIEAREALESQKQKDLENLAEMSREYHASSRIIQLVKQIEEHAAEIQKLRTDFPEKTGANQNERQKTSNDHGRRA